MNSGSRQPPLQKESDEPLLCEVMISSEHLGDAVMPYGFHGDAVHETVALVRTTLVQSEPAEERVAVLRYDGDVRIPKYRPGDLGGLLP